MYIFPDLIGEVEFKEFNSEDYAALSDVLDDVLCKYLRDYCNNPEADSYIVDCIENFLGNKIKTMTLHYDLKSRGIIDLVRSISPVNISSMENEFSSIHEKLQYLNDNIDSVMLHIPARTKEAWDNFYQHISCVIARMQVKGIPTTKPDILHSISANRFVFYKPNDKGHSTYTDILFKQRRQWTMCLRGIEYIEFCKENGINITNRRMF